MHVCMDVKSVLDGIEKIVIDRSRHYKLIYHMFLLLLLMMMMII